MLSNNCFLAGWLLFLVLSAPRNIAAHHPPDEGMWLPLLISQNFDEMKRLGIQLTPEQIYSVNNSSLKDAIVSFGGYCTGSFVSDQGLIFTNHHCGYSSIQFHSSPEKDYLTNGFWAKTKSEELPTPELFVQVLQRMENITTQVMDGSNFSAGKANNIAMMAAENGRYVTEVKPMFGGSEYYLFVYERFTDVRMVGAPPSSIGKFGGDTDNWMWPRHTGDFSVFRVYADKDNKPAAYSPDNVPYKPKHFLPITLEGYKVGDFAMILGFPGRTNRYLTSRQIQHRQYLTNPAIIKLYRQKMTTMKREMDKDNEVRIKVADIYASGMNGYKYYIGMNEGLEKLNLIAQVRNQEAAFMAWAEADPERKNKYANILPAIDKLYDDWMPYSKLHTYLTQGILNTTGITFAANYWRLYKQQETMGSKIDSTTQVQLVEDAEKHFKDYAAATDQKILQNLLTTFYFDIPVNQQPKFLREIMRKYGERKPATAIEKYVKKLYGNTRLTNINKVKALIKKADFKKLKKDPMIEYIDGMIEPMLSELGQRYEIFEKTEAELNRRYIAALKEMYPDRKFYPDANFTLRLSYGSVQGYAPSPSVSYEHYTTIDELVKKYKPKDEEFDVPAKLLELQKNKDYGRYTTKEGVMRVAFLTNNDITGGNSGSPVINGKGQLIGLAFDGNWEAMTGDIVFDKALKRTINVDIRYVLFIIDKFADAKNLIEELKILN